MTKEYLSVPFEVKSMDEDDDGFFTFTGYASTFGNVDLGDDVMVPGAFTKSLSKQMPILLWQHNMQEPLGTFTEAFEDEKGLFVRGRMPKEDSLVKGRVMPQMRVGSIKTMSIGYSTIDFEMDNGIRHLKEVDLWEGSLVTFAMNTQAVITSMKSNVFAELPDEEREALEKQITEVFEKSGIESPFDKSGIGLAEVEGMDKKEFEQLLRDNGFSRKLSTAIASKFIRQSESVGDQRDSGLEALNEKIELLKKTLKPTGG